MRRLKHWEPLIGYILLTGMVTGLLIFAAYQAWIFHPTTGILTVIVLIGAMITLYEEGKHVIKLLKTNPQNKTSQRIGNFLAVFIGGILTFYLAQNIVLGAVVAAGLVAILVHIILPEYGVPAYCGAFVGMSSSALLFNNFEIALASSVAGVVYVLTTKVFAGVGGKLGTIALISAAATSAGLQRQFLFTPIYDMDTNVLIMISAIIATALTFYLNCYRGNGPVLASGVVGLAGGLILPVLFPQHGDVLAVVTICASFTGMSSEGRCPAFWHILVAGFFTGVLFIFSTPMMGGAGGKLGTIAFASVLSIFGFTHFFQQVYGTKSHRQTNQEA